jgi:4-hydroxy-tetrahydrodipicolinate synthase
MGTLEGVLVVLVTPFSQNGRTNLDGLRENVNWLVEEGVHGVVALGSTGEFASLDDDQASRVRDVAIEAADERIPVVIGAGAETTEQTISNVKCAAAAGAAGALVIPPWYYTPDADELVHHYTRIGEASTIPVMIYNNPFTSKVDIAPETLARLADVPHIDSVKESSGNIRRIAEIRTLTNDRLSVFCGWEDMAYESFVMGAVGWVCVIGNVIPKMAVQLFDLIHEERNLEDAWPLYVQMLPLLRYLEYEGKTQKALKYMLDRMGLHGGSSSSPKLPLSSEDRSKIDRIMADLGIQRVG